MSDYDKVLIEEKEYLKSVISFLDEHISMAGELADKQKKNLVELRREMFAGGVSTVDDYDRNIEISQFHAMERMETAQYEHKLSNVEKYKKVYDKPYFARFDFTEDEEALEKIYLGYQNIMDDKSYNVFVYDWRAPIASMFYRNEIGKASYEAPCGEIRGTVSLKRQYEIERGELKYYFDASVAITDDMLKQALGHNASSYMKNIVETIQKEQDLIIRDKGNDLLMVQGVAGSGKTSIAMHRIAFLLYERMSEGLISDNIMIISPNHLFGEYVSTVLPELGENNVCYSTMEDLFQLYFKGRYKMRTRVSQLEHMITHKHRNQIRNAIRFKGSSGFVELLDRLVEAYEKEIIEFRDVYYAGELIASKESLRKKFLDNAIKLAIGRRLKRMEHSLEKKLRECETAKRKELFKEFKGKGGYFNDEEIDRRLGEYRGKSFEAMRSFVRIDYFKLYQRLFKDDVLFNKLSKDLTLPKSISSIRQHTVRSLRPEILSYEDGMAMLYLKLKIEDEHLCPQIKQVLIDEAQDYYPLQYKVLGAIFKGAQYTVLGDIGQTIEKNESEDLYDEIIKALEPKKALKLKLDKSYRSSYEISLFTQKLREGASAQIAYERHDEAPVIAGHENEGQLMEWLEDKVKEYEANGYETIAIICKSKRDVNHVYSKLAHKIAIHKLDEQQEEFTKGVLIMPIYMAKGLEYDAVIVYQVNEESYHESEDKQLLYIACTRALHRLSLCHTGELSHFLIE